MVDRLHILIVTELKKPLAIASIVAGGGMRRRDDGGNTNNVQCKAKLVTMNPPCITNISE
jgi:hypothetical protein